MNPHDTRSQTSMEIKLMWVPCDPLNLQKYINLFLIQYDNYNKWKYAFRKGNGYVETKVNRKRI